jgi:cytochrome b
LARIVVMICTGLVMTGGATSMQVATENAGGDSGNWSASVKKDEESGKARGLKHLTKAVHKVTSNFVLFLCIPHGAGVAVSGRPTGRTLLAPMPSGRRRSAAGK